MTEQTATVRPERMRPAAAPGQRGLDPVGRELVRQGVLSTRALFDIDARIERTDARLADALHRRLGLPQSDIAAAEARVAGALVVDPLVEPPDPVLIARLGAARCARLGVLPWRRAGGDTVVLTARPEVARRAATELIAALGPISLAVTTEAALNTALQRAARSDLIRRAETGVDAELSCRNWRRGRAAVLILALLGLIGAGMTLAPQATFGGLAALAILTLVLTTALRAAALLRFLIDRRRPAPAPAARLLRRPVVSILVPLYRERAIASHLLSRLRRVDYPHECLDICLVLEADDAVTQATIAAIRLPPWIRAITVPEGTLKTKPRALNYALEFARGSIIGIYDAEDAPAPDQIGKVVARFAAAPPRVACLQGVLDYYNDSANWIARCFTLEYAMWFRVMLPGLEKLGLVIPLGGTTLFLRRSVIEELGGWDAHNVTEDADLGIRLARAGYRTELIETVTEEEANCHIWPWIKQRSRWLKGYGLTYAVHMRRPARLWRDLGPRAFLRLQVHFLGTLVQVLLAPVLWSFWAIPLGLPHPVTGALAGPLVLTLAAVFVTSELLNVTAAALAVRRAGKPGLMIWAPTLHLYFPLAAVAAWKGLFELMSRPFYWDKTAHGLYLPQPGGATRRPPPPRRRASAG